MSLTIIICLLDWLHIRREHVSAIVIYNYKSTRVNFSFFERHVRDVELNICFNVGSPMLDLDDYWQPAPLPDKEILKKIH